MSKDNLYTPQFGDVFDDMKDDKIYILSDLQHKKGSNYRLFCKSMRKSGKKEIPFVSNVLLLFRWLFLSPIFNSYIDDKANPYKNKILFSDFNKEKVFVNVNNQWTCPCCKTINEGIEHCRCCGVLPNLYKSQKNNTD